MSKLLVAVALLFSISRTDATAAAASKANREQQRRSIVRAESLPSRTKAGAEQRENSLPHDHVHANRNMSSLSEPVEVLPHGSHRQEKNNVEQDLAKIRQHDYYSAAASLVENGAAASAVAADLDARQSLLLQRMASAPASSCQRFKDGKPLYEEVIPGSIKCLAGVPIYNFHKAFDGSKSTSLLELAAQRKKWLVTFPRSYTNKNVSDICSHPVGSLKCSWGGHPTPGGVSSVIMEGTLADLERELTEHPDAVFVEPDHLEFADPEEQTTGTSASGVTCALQTMLDKGSSLSAPASWGLDRIDNPGSLDCRSQDLDKSTHGEGAIIWILDTGVRVTHDEFEGRAMAAIDFSLGEDLVECFKSNDERCGIDYNGHGTHCAGTAAGKTFGVANKASIVSAKVLDDDKSGGISRFIQAFDYIIDDFAARDKRNATIISMSVGGKGSSPSLAEAVDRAVDAGLVVVVSAGNDAEDACAWTPASVDSAITVGATNTFDELSVFSNYGYCIDILAPGTDVVSASHEGDSLPSTQSGTSMACPHVAGAAALALTFEPKLHASKNKMTQANLRKVLVEGAAPGAIANLKPMTTNRLLNINSFTEARDTSSKRYWFGIFLTLVGALAATWLVLHIRKRRSARSAESGALLASSQPATAKADIANPASQPTSQPDAAKPTSHPSTTA